MEGGRKVVSCAEKVPKSYLFEPRKIAWLFFVRQRRWERKTSG